MAVVIKHATKAQHVAKMRESYGRLRGVEFAALCAQIQGLIDDGVFVASDFTTAFGAGRAAVVRSNIARVASSHATIKAEVGE